MMHWLEERKLGFRLRAGVVPVVPAAIMMDLSVGDFTIRPDAEAQYQACLAAEGQAQRWAKCSARRLR